ncbi:archaellin/type IV pilin N-terminal domain-containing protein [Halobaculum litoreum]|uniref:Archaellin/type IV pilin N-terminal domain-containing protein n=1 Tax=Halobaculum litoreum TaxID=3031998 RepID=A0ABD5XT84_9EURY
MRTATPSPDTRTDADPPERALSPLAGVAVMVVLTVALAALIGSLVVAAGVASPGVPRRRRSSSRTRPSTTATV